MPIPKVYAKTGQPALANYDYVDIAEGTGINRFYGFNTTTSGASLFHLITNAIYTYDIESTLPETPGINFDLTTFNLPKVIKGTAIFRSSIYWVGTAAHWFFIVATLQKVGSDGSTITNIGDVTTLKKTGTGAAWLKNYVLPISLTETHFKRGEKLRLNLTATKSHPDDVLNIGNDPANRDGSLITPATTYPTKLEVYVPFRLDL